ncbi:MAG: formylglycine-generating enzyme family protein, partial [Nitrospinae bacterium]|nr:formylglycine-generating enzyme family protein [Nitrospinota bacterium]
EAVAYCKWSGKRLPTEAEWEKAGRGKRPIKYPWGDSPPDSEKLNYNEEKMHTTPVGSYENGKSDYGVYDLSGNAAEWVHDWHFPEYYLFSPKENPPGPEKGQYKVIRGGNWRNTAEYVDLTYRNATTPRIRNTGVGFRCAKSAKE